MLNSSFVDPKGIIVVGGSSNPEKPGGKILVNLKDGRYSGDLAVINPGKKDVQGLPAYKTCSEIPFEADLGIVAVPAAYCLPAIQDLYDHKGVQSVIIISAGFGETGSKGKALEDQLTEYATKNNIQIFGPNCTGVISPKYSGAFTTPIPESSKKGVDFVSASGATAVFVMEQALEQGVKFNHVYSVGNALNIHVEDVLEFVDVSFNPRSSKVLLLYMETIKNPSKLFKHAKSLNEKGCKLIGLKAGITRSGVIAAASHTGAISNPSDAVESLFEKAGITMCTTRSELVNSLLVSLQKELKGKNIAVVTHAGGPGVLATDALDQRGFSLHHPCHTVKDSLEKKLPKGASVINPFDILATGGKKELELVMEYVTESKCYDGVIVIFGSPGLFQENDVFEYLAKFIESSKIPVFTVIPSPLNARNEIQLFKNANCVYHADESQLVDALYRVYKASHYPDSKYEIKNSNFGNKGERIPQKIVNAWLKMAGFSLVRSLQTDEKDEAITFMEENKEVVVKMSGSKHKTELGGVVTGVRTREQLEDAVNTISAINGKSVLIQPQIKGFEIYLGIMYDEVMGHIMYFGAGGTNLEIEKDIAVSLFPLNRSEVELKLRNLRNFNLWKGFRNQAGVETEKLINEILKLNDLIEEHPEIKELDINPLIINSSQSSIVDARIVI